MSTLIIWKSLIFQNHTRTIVSSRTNRSTYGRDKFVECCCTNRKTTLWCHKMEFKLLLWATFRKEFSKPTRDMNFWSILWIPIITSDCNPRTASFSNVTTSTNKSSQSKTRISNTEVTILEITTLSTPFIIFWLVKWPSDNFSWSRVFTSLRRTQTSLIW